MTQTPSKPFQGLDTLIQEVGKCSDSHRDMLDYFFRNGSHILGSITWGNVMGQVFVYDKKSFEEVMKGFPEDMRTGEDSGFFRNFTQLRDEKYKTGYVKEVGRLWLASGDSEFTDIAKVSDDPINLLKESFFQVIRQSDLNKALYAIETVTAIGFELLPVMDQLVKLSSSASIPTELIEKDSIDDETIGQAALISTLAIRGQLTEANARFHRFGEEGAPAFVKKQWPDYAAI